MSSKIKVVEPKATILGITRPYTWNVAEVYENHPKGAIRGRDYTVNPQAVMELAGRGCYEAYDRANPNTDSWRGYIHNLLKQKHYSVLEHASVTMQLTGISRSDSHEIVRHRHFSFSQQSQRYVLVEPPYEIVMPPAVKDQQEAAWIRGVAYHAFTTAKIVTDSLRDQGLPRKKAAEAARAILPNCAATHMVITGNIRSWMEFISKRDHPAADASIRRVACEIVKVLEVEFPEIFDEESRTLWDDQFAQEGVKNND